MNKRIISLLVAVCTVIFTVACAGSDTTEEKDSETIDVTETASPDTTAFSTDEETTKSLTVVPGAAPKPETDEGTTVSDSETEPLQSTKAPDTTSAKTEPITTAETTRAPETTVAHAHSYTRKEQVDPTCSKEGTATFYCECGAYISNTIQKLPHEFGEATCVSAPACKVCGAVEGSPLLHDIKNGVCSLCNNRVYRIGITVDELVADVGAPSVTYTEETTEGTVTTYVYCSDYTKLKIFQIVGSTVSGAYITGKDFIFYYEPQNATLIPAGGAEEKMQIISNKTIDVLTFTDVLVSKDISAVWAKLSSFKYGFETVSDRTVQGKLCMHITNHYRAINGASALEYSEKAESASRVHSVDMASNNYFEHSDLSGRTVGDRLRDEGLNVYCAENIQAGYFYINNHETGNIFFVTHGWYVSEGHRVNMLEPSYTYFGEATAYHPDSTYHYYSTQVFYKE